MGIADSALRDRVVFVQGAPRSGTTWLTLMLANHPSIAGIGSESHLFDLGVDRLFDRTAIPFQEMVKLDYLYVAEWSLWNDVKLLIRTAPVVLAARGH